MSAAPLSEAETTLAMPTVVLTDLGHAYQGGDFLFRHVEATLHAGRICAVVGPSGSGKSTLLAILAGWLDPTEGSVARHGVRSFEWVPQLPLGVARRSVVDHVMLPMLVHGVPTADAHRRALGLLAEFGLGELADQPYGSLSGGEAQRLMLARAVATRSDLLLIDEPTASLDRTSARTVIARIRNLAGLGCIVAVATHDGELRAACDDVLDLGHAQAGGSLEAGTGAGMGTEPMPSGVGGAAGAVSGNGVAR